MDGTKQNIYPSWHFNDEIFTNLDWSIPVEHNLEDLYKKRALQLRESYDYIVILFSGGADSTTVLQTFVKNKIFIDEIYVYWPVSVMKNKKIHQADISNKHGSNILSEWNFSIEPKLNYIKKYFPRTKITIADYTDIIGTNFDEDFLKIAGHNLLAGYFMRQKKLLSAAQKISGNKKIALVAGIDKPRVCVDKHQISGYFLDIPCYSQRPNNADDNRVIELFYWTPSCPELTIKSYQTVANYIKRHPEHAKYFVNEYNEDPDYNSIQRTILTSLLYRDWDNNTFQVGKSTSDIYPEHDYWIHKFFDKELFVKSWEHAYKSQIKMIDKKYIKYNSKNEPVGFVGFVSPMFKILDL